jgi:chromosomal replication initiation ATPase DnaA
VTDHHDHDSLLDTLYRIRDDAQREIDFVRGSRERATRLAAEWATIRQNLYPGLASAYDVLTIVAKSFRLLPHDLIESGRRHATARHVAMWVLREHRLSYPQIGSVMGRDHTTAMYSVRKVEADEELLDLAHQVLAKTWASATPLRAV